MKKWCVGILFILSSAVFYAQEKSDLQSLDNVNLIDEAKKTKLELQNPAEIYRSTQNVLQSLEKAIQNIEQRLQKKPPQKEINSIDYLNALLSFLQERETLYVEVISKWKEYHKQLEEAKQQKRQFAKIADRLDLLLTEIQLRLEAKTIRNEEVPEDLQEFDAQQALQQKKKRDENLEPIKQQHALDQIKKLEKNFIEVTEDIIATQKKIEAANEQAQLLAERKQAKEDFAQKGTDSLLALFSTFLLELPKKETIIKEKTELYNSNQQQLSKLVVNLPIPDIKDIQLDSKIATEVEKKWKYGKSLLEYQKNKQKNLKEQEKLLKATISTLQSLQKTTAEYQETLMQVDVIYEILKERNVDSIKENAPQIDIEKQKRQQATYEEKEKEFTQQQQQVNKQISEIQKTIVEQQKSVQEAEKLYNEEKKMEQWIIEAEKFNNDQLRVALLQDLQRANNHQQQIQSINAQLAGLQKAIAKKKEELSQIQSPFVIRSQEALKELYDTASNTVKSIAEEKNMKTLCALIGYSPQKTKRNIFKN